MEFARKSLNSDSIAFDVGAHHGIQTVPMALWVGQDGQVFAFEANGANAVTLQANIAPNELANCHALHSAVSGKSGHINISGETVSTGHREHNRTPCCSLDEFCESSGVDNIDFIKIDVEGYEGEVLKGAQRLLARRPNISLELHQDDIGKYGFCTDDIFRLIDTDAYEISYMQRQKSWEETTQIRDLSELPYSGIVNVFLSCKSGHK